MGLKGAMVCNEMQEPFAVPAGNPWQPL
ncbi:hypothetical protein MY9_3628 [Bacillus sp. JS]|nr:hypothetical protein MY9_3628 [Bacillus sp. JS]